MDEEKLRFQELVNEAVETIRWLAPKDTGNLAYNAVKYEWIDENTCQIYVDGEAPDIGIAPYMDYTNKRWLDPRWHGRKNPNEGWWDKVCTAIIHDIAYKMSGELKKW